ncbi:3-deoxy-7-phosphoheptulonate synthase [Streptomyces sp. N2-109]|uniref:Phospho-2-dehydro-3-deoxyheptonate aldolase n=1 Tax=Streptomyces gossypii TaxID=2883101 RepID=A0ABT2K5G0_9ACTN|nr:3-deoxy-7-phosphoheptulonate synthase [Streptomyces gossypii]MCT2594730.1 3-deoxy-7-phosphoheptulonate synthase [Streptomyces gossypii]
MKPDDTASTTASTTASPTTSTSTSTSTATGSATGGQPAWPDPAALEDVTGRLALEPPLVSAAGCDRLRERLAQVARGEAFLLQGGDCVETFDGLAAGQIRAKVGTLQQTAGVLCWAVGLPVVTVGRIAGQYTAHGTPPTETRAGMELPAYRGDCVNDTLFTAAARTPDPRRLARMYHASAATLEVIRDRTADGRSGTAEFYTSHEALILDYEAALTRRDPRTSQPYGLSAHLLWIGEHTRRLDGPHVEFAARVRNPVAVELGPGTAPGELRGLVDRLDPEREPGRLTLIARMGRERVRELLPPLIEEATGQEAPVAWICDPMHGNTTLAADGRPTRRYDDVLDELTGFFEAHAALGTRPGGVHLELTGDRVTECTGGPQPNPACPPGWYESAGDPRLNRDQSVGLAFHIADLSQRLAARPPSPRAGHTQGTARAGRGCRTDAAERTRTPEGPRHGRTA